MRIRAWRPESFRPWVESVALHIGDPVARLRFLRVAAPVVPDPSRSRRDWTILLPFLALAAVLTLVFLMYAAAHPRFVELPSAPKIEAPAKSGSAAAKPGPAP
jgi:hypothetical protein